MKKLLVTLVALFSFNQLAFAETDPSDYLKNVASDMVAVIKENKEALKNDQALAEELVRKHLLPVIDQESFAKKTLGKSIWTSISKTQQKQFIDGYIQRVINKYAKGLSLYDGQDFVFEPAEYGKSKNVARVKSELKQEGSTPLGIYYYLSNDSGKWLITNMVIGGSNVTKSYKLQFRPRIDEIGFDKFLTELATSTDDDDLSSSANGDDLEES